MNAVIAWSVRHRALVVVFVAIFVVLGIVGSSRLRLDAFPDLTNVQVQVLTNSPGMSSHEVELLITTPLERSLAGTPNVEEIRSLSRTGVSAITVVFKDNTDLYLARQLVAERVNLAQEDIPQSAGQAEIAPPSTGLGEVFQFVVQSDEHTVGELSRIFESMIAPRLQTVPGIVEVNAWGAAPPELHILLDPWRLAATGLRIQDVHDAVRQEVAREPGGAQLHGDEQTLIRGLANPDSPEALARIPLRGQGPSALYLGDVAHIERSTALDVGIGSANGQGRVIFAMAQLLAGEDARRVVQEVQTQLDDIRTSLPDGVEVDVIYDRAKLVNGTLKTVAKSLTEGGLLVILVLLLLLGDLRAGLVVASIIPLSMLGALSGLSLLGMSGNLMSLGAIDFGLIVDGTIVLVESIMAMEIVRRTNLQERIIEQSQKVSRPVLFAVGIIIVVYLPILAMWGVEGKLFRPMATTVLLALTTALILTFTWIPAISSWVLRPTGAQRTRLASWLEARYSTALDHGLTHPRLYIGIAILTLIGSGILATQLGVAFIPRLEEGDIVIQTGRPASITMDKALEEATRIERVALSFPEVTAVGSRTGSPALATDPMGMEEADILLHLRPQKEWTTAKTTEELMTAIAERIEQEAPGAAITMSQPIEMRFNELLEGITSDVGVKVFGPDLDVLNTLGRDIAQILDSIPGSADVAPPQSEGATSINVVVSPDKTARYGLRAQDIFDLTTAVQRGHEVGRIVDGAFQDAVVLRLDLPKDEVLADLPLLLPTGRSLPLREVATLEHASTPASIMREQGTRRVVVEANVRGTDLGGFVETARDRIEKEISLPPGYWIEWSGKFEQLRTAALRTALMLPAVLILILIMLRGALGRFKPGVLIFLNVPIAACGGILALALRGLPLSMSAIVGFIALFGVAVMNGVVLVSRIQELHHTLPAAQAAHDAAHERFRPVIMTAAVAGIGFVPMALNTTIGAEVQRPLATVVIGGLVTATLLTLLVLPSLYVLWFKNEDSPSPVPHS